MKPKKKKKKWFFCLCPKPRKEDRGRQRFYLLKAISFKSALKLYALKCLGMKKKVFKKKYIKEKYYYYDGLIYIECLASHKKILGFEDKDIYSTGYLYELCRECVSFKIEEAKPIVQKKTKKKKKKKKRGGLL